MGCQASGEMPRVAVAVVTFNRRQLLAECLEAILAQTHPVERVFVVDNASTDGTPELLRDRGLIDEPRLTYIRLERNLGGAGGFSRAVEEARGVECDWIWLMDDDAEPPRESLGRLMASAAAADPANAALAQRAISPDGSVQLNARGFLGRRPSPLPLEAYEGGSEPEVDFATFVGFAVRARVARAIDPPRADFFIWADDYEYCCRVRSHGAVRVVATSSIVHKDVGHVAYANRRSALWNRLFGWSFGATQYAGFWRNICGVRNYVWIRKTYAGESALGAVATAGAFLAKALLYDERPLRRVPWIVRATIDGRLGVFHNIEPAEWRDRVSRGEW